MKKTEIVIDVKKEVTAEWTDGIPLLHVESSPKEHRQYQDIKTT
jgi:hypothetical protein